MDKTLLIRDLLDHPAMVTLITRPRRFGKTLNMSMLQAFFETGSGGKEFFEKLNIWRCGEAYTRHCEAYPVISLSLKDVKFELVGISDIREGDDYPGIRVALQANYPPISIPLTVDVTTGDVITLRVIEYTFPLLFDDRTISILDYNLETVLAEKIETVLSRSIANTRPRDFLRYTYPVRSARCRVRCRDDAASSETDSGQAYHEVNRSQD